MAKVEMDIRYVAKLSRLHIDDSEVDKFKKDMANIVTMVENLPDFEETNLKLNKDEAMTLRDDTIAPSMPREAILKNAPQTEAGCFVVPKVVEE